MRARKAPTRAADDSANAGRAFEHPGQGLKGEATTQPIGESRRGRALAETLDKVAETIVDEAKGDLLNALILERALACELFDLVKQKVEARRRSDAMLEARK
jgi:hypothetical protein